MAEIVIAGGGIVGLSTAMLLAKDGHQVTILERDATAPPEDPTEAWEGWERQGVNQFRMLHFFMPRFRMLAERDLPELLAAWDAAGGLRGNPLQSAPAELTGGFRPGDEVHEALTGRRPVFESAAAKVAAETDGVTIRRGVAVAGLLTGPSAMHGVPHVTGVRTDAGDDIAADLVVDMTGRRSPLPKWLDAIGARPPVEELEDSGFLYYGRHFRSADGSVPFAFGPLLQPYGSVSLLTLPADNGTWGIGVITSAKDAAVRKLKDKDVWTRVVASYPLIAHWLDGEPIDDDVAVMAKIEDRYRRFAVDGAPCATGVVAVADSWSCTNPSLGRGMSIGLTHAVAMRDLLRATPLDDPAAFALAFDQMTETEMQPWYRATNHFDRHRLAEIDAAVEGRPYEGDEQWHVAKALEAASMRDPELLRVSLATAGLTQPPDEVFAAPGLVERIMELGADWREAQPPGPNRAQLLTIIAGD